jgi:glycosyltransferase involved in cell wall biosynthesis
MASPILGSIHPPIIPSLAVIVPVFNIVQSRGEPVILQTLESIAASIDYFRDHYPFSAEVEAELVLVDDGSTDGSLAVLTPWAQSRKDCQLVSYAQNLGAAAARNTGVSLSKGQALFFCDADDLFLPEHIYWGFTVLNHPIRPTSDRPPDYFGAVRTKIRVADPLHPHWQQALENTLVLNLCVRRELHQFVQGFPEDQVFKTFPYGGEDLAYATWLQQFCHLARVDQTTVEYRRYPGSQFDRQLGKFQAAPGEYTESLSLEHQQQLLEIGELIQQRQQALQQKL